MQKPRSYRKKLAYSLTLFFGLIIFFLWMIITMDNVKDFLKTAETDKPLQNITPSLREKYQQQDTTQQDQAQELERLGY